MGKNHKQRTPEKKMQIVLEGLKSDSSVAEVCRRHGIYESQYYQWKKKLLGSADEVFSRDNKRDLEKERLKDENERLKRTIVEQSCELQVFKKNNR